MSILDNEGYQTIHNTKNPWEFTWEGRLRGGDLVRTQDPRRYYEPIRMQWVSCHAGPRVDLLRAEPERVDDSNGFG